MDTAIENIKTEIKKITTVKDSKAKTNLEQNVNILEEIWKLEKIKHQEEIINLQKKIIENQEELTKKIEKIIEKNNNTTSYAQVLKKQVKKQESPQEERFSIIISSSIKSTKADEICNKIQKDIKLNQLKIGINGLRKTNNEQIIISCPKKEYTTILTEEIKKLNYNLEVNEIKKKKPKLIIKGLKSNLSEDEIIDGIITQNEGIQDIILKNEENKINLITEIKYKHPKLDASDQKDEKQHKFSNYIIETSGTTRKSLIALGKLNIQYQRVKIEDCDPLTQCYHCCKFMHTASRCLHRTDPSVCPHCTGDHIFAKCPAREKTPVCANCTSQNNKYGEKNNTDHKAFSDICPYKNKMLKVARDRIDY